MDKMAGLKVYMSSACQHKCPIFVVEISRKYLHAPDEILKQREDIDQSESLIFMETTWKNNFPTLSTKLVCNIYFCFIL